MNLVSSFKELWSSSSFRTQTYVGLVLTAIAVPVTYWMSDNDIPYVYIPEGSYIRPPDPDDGGEITAVWAVEKIKRICPASSRRQIIDPQSGAILASYDLIPALTTTKIGDTEIVKTFALPKRALPYEEPVGYRSQICFECNPYQKYVRARCVMTPTLTFQVRKPT